MLQANTVLALCAQYIFGQEIGEEGTPHLQGAVRFKTKQRFTAVVKLFPGKGVHWEKQVKKWDFNVEYCRKDLETHGDWSLIHGNIPEASKYKPREKRCMEREYANVVWRPWQQNVIDIIRGEVHPRKVHWFWEPTGDSGKSFLTKWLCMNFRCIIGGGKQADVFHQVAKAYEESEDADPELILLDIPRTSQKYCSYAAIEALKNGLVNSGKYEGGVYAFCIPHVIVFSNEEPAYETMSQDRWAVHRVRKKRTVGEALAPNRPSSTLACGLPAANSRFLIV